MKTILLCNAAANQRALAHRLHAVAPLAAIGIIEIPATPRKDRLRDRFASVSVGLPLRRAWFGMLDHYDKAFPGFPDVPTAVHQGVNADTVLDLVQRERPGIVLVSGTNLLKPLLINEIGRTGRILNLHTGISPYIKGGPNCTSWALALGELRLIGNTIMWLDTGIDSGNIVATERTPLSGRETLTELHVKVMDHGHDLYCRCLARIAQGHEVPSVPQSELGPGRVLLSKHWTGAQIARAVYNYLRFYRPANVMGDQPRRLVPLD